MRRTEPDLPTYRYTLDRDDRITSFNAAWAAFAVENDAPDLPGRVLGTRLRDHIADATTRLLYQALFEAVRTREEAVRVPFRCDAPHMAREMELEIAPAPDGGLALSARLLRERPRLPITVLDPGVERAGRGVRMCGWCKRAEVDGKWRELEEAIRLSRVLSNYPVPPISHGICPACGEQMISAIERLQGA